MKLKVKITLPKSGHDVYRDIEVDNYVKTETLIDLRPLIDKFKEMDGAESAN